jgi:beta-lactamase regulating signal transducer with metallopeptidase domain
METFALAQNALFYRLLQVSWQAAVLAGLIALVRWTFRERLSPGWRHAFWFLVLARLVVPSLPQSPLSLFNFMRPSAPLALLGPARLDERVSVQIAARAGVREKSAPSGGASRTGGSGGEWGRRPNSAPVHPREETASGYASILGLDIPDQARPARVAAAGRAAPAHVDRPTAQFLAALPWCWSAGMLAFGMHLLWQTAKFSRRLRAARPIAGGAAIDVLRECARRMKLRRVPLLVETPAVRSPALYGLIRPRLLLPEGLAESFSTRELRHVLLHELGHVKRQDMAVHWLSTCVQILHWFNPLLWFAFAQMRLDRELACDALVLGRAGEGESRSYGETIIKILAGLDRSTAATGLVGILEDKQQMKSRIRMIARFPQSSSWPALAVCVFVGLAGVALTDARTQENPEQPQVTSAAPAQSQLPEPQKSQVLPETQAPAQRGSLIEDSRLLIELGKLDEAEARLQQAAHVDPEDRSVLYYLSLIKELRSAQETRKREFAAKEQPGEVQNSRLTPAGREEAAAPKRVSGPSSTPSTPGRQTILRKLQTIVLDAVAYENLPLTDVVRDLTEQARNADPDGRGINFIINPALSSTQPGEASATGVASLNEVPIRLRLKNVRVRDVLDAITHVAEPPIRYTVQEYGIVLVAGRAELQLFTRTFRVDPNSFVEGLQSVAYTGGKATVPASATPAAAGAPGRTLGAASGSSPPSAINVNGPNPPLLQRVRDFFMAVGVDFTTNAITVGTAGFPNPGGKALFFNDRTGLLLVRATSEELDTVEKALQVLNTAPPQVSIEAKVVEICRDDQHPLGFDGFLGNIPAMPPNPDSSSGGTFPGQSPGPAAEQHPKGTQVPVLGDIPGLGRLFRSDSGPAAAVPALNGILTDPQLRVVQRALEQRPGTSVLSMPRLTTLSSRQARMELTDLGFSLDVLPRVLTDGFSVQLDVDFVVKPKAREGDEPELESIPSPSTAPDSNSHLRVATRAIVWDGQTMVLGPFPRGDTKPAPGEASDGKGQKHLILFLTPTIIDPAGNRVHAGK